MSLKVKWNPVIIEFCELFIAVQFIQQKKQTMKTLLTILVRQS